MGFRMAVVSAYAEGEVDNIGTGKRPRRRRETVTWSSYSPIRAQWRRGPKCYYLSGCHRTCKRLRDHPMAHPVEIIGSKGQRLESVFEEPGGPQMYLGTAIDGFPNFFTLFGPNTVTGHSSVILCSENQVSYAMNFIKPILNGTFSYVEIKRRQRWLTKSTFRELRTRQSRMTLNAIAGINQLTDGIRP